MYTTDKTCGHKLYWVLENRHLIYYVSVMLHNNSEAIIRMEVDMPYGNTSKIPKNVRLRPSRNLLKMVSIENTYLEYAQQDWLGESKKCAKK